MGRPLLWSLSASAYPSLLHHIYPLACAFIICTPPSIPASIDSALHVVSSYLICSSFPSRPFPLKSVSRTQPHIQADCSYRRTKQSQVRSTSSSASSPPSRQQQSLPPLALRHHTPALPSLYKHQHFGTLDARDTRRPLPARRSRNGKTCGGEGDRAAVVGRSGGDGEGVGQLQNGKTTRRRISQMRR